jgi:hypothetical protein
MRKLALICSIVSLACLAGPAAYAAEVEVNWDKPEKFTDIRPANESRHKYRERVMKHFAGFFADMAQKLPEGYSWKVTVTDIDLAGEIDPFAGGAGQELRVVKDIYSPAIKFSHVLQDKYGEQILNQQEQLRDMSFMNSLRSYHSNEEFNYEKQMLLQWFSRDVLPKVEAAQATPPKISDNH